MGAIGAHAIVKKSDEMKDVWKVRNDTCFREVSR